MSDKLQQAFITGMCKRAEELGFDKKAFVLPLASALIRGIGGMMIPGWMVGKAVDLVKKTPTIQKNKAISDILTKWHPTKGEGIKAMAANIASGHFLGSVIQPHVDRVAELFYKEPAMEPMPMPMPMQPPPMQYYPSQYYPRYANQYPAYAQY